MREGVPGHVLCTWPRDARERHSLTRVITTVVGPPPVTTSPPSACAPRDGQEEEGAEEVLNIVIAGLTGCNRRLRECVSGFHACENPDLGHPAQQKTYSFVSNEADSPAVRVTYVATSFVEGDHTILVNEPTDG